MGIKHTFIFGAGPGAVGTADVLDMATAVLCTSVVPPLLCHPYKYKLGVIYVIICVELSLVARALTSVYGMKAIIVDKMISLLFTAFFEHHGIVNMVKLSLSSTLIFYL